MRLGPSVGCGARAHSGPCPYWLIWLAVLCQGPLQAAPQGLGLGIRLPVRYPAAAGVSLRPSRPQSGQRPRLRGPSGRRLNCGPPQGQGLQQQPAAGAPARLGGGTPSEGPRAATPARRAGPEGRTAPQPPHSGGRAAPEHLRRDRHGGGAMQGPQSGPAGAWPCIAEGCPRATAAAQLDRDGARRGPALGRTLPRPAPAGGWTGRAAARRPGWAGVRPAGRWGRVGRPRGPDGSPYHRPQAVAPFSLPAAVASDGGRVWGVTQQQTAAPPLSAAAQGPAWWPLRCGAAADAHGVTGPQSGPRPQLGPVMLIEAGRFLSVGSGAGPRPHLAKSHLSDTFCTVGRQ